MKVNQIVSEHKKGVRAMKYSKKTKGAVPVYGPDAKNAAKLQPVKPTGPLGEATLKAYDGKMATIDDPEHGKTINLDLTKPENAASLKPNDNGQLEYDATPDMGAAGATPGGQPAGPKPGSEVTIKADEAGSVGGDPTDDYIDDIVDHEYGDQQVDELLGFGNKSPEEWAKVSPQMAKLLQFQAKYKGTPYEKQIADRIKFLQDRLDMDAGEVAGAGGVPKDPVPPEQFNTNQLKEADNVLLDKMLTIAGLR